MTDLLLVAIGALPGAAAVVAGFVRWRVGRRATRALRRTPPLARIALITAVAVVLASCHSTHRGAFAHGPVPQSTLPLQEPLRWRVGALAGQEVASQNGLLASYFAGAAYERLDHQQIDPNVDFEWDAINAPPVTSPDAFDTDEGCGGFCGLPPRWGIWSIAWEGYLEVPTDGVYLLSIHVNNGGWVEMKDPATGSLVQVVSAPGGPGFEGDAFSAGLTLGKGRHYLRMSFFQNGPPTANAHLLWQPPGASGLTIIPSSALFTQAAPPAPPPDDALADQIAASFGGDPTVGALIAEPVNTLTGNLTLRATDLEIPGRGPPLRLARTYNARDGRAGVFGRGWSSALAWRVRPTGSVEVTRGDGRRDVHRRNVDGSYAPPQGVFDVLTKRADGWTLLTPDQLSIEFSASGAPIAMRDRNGNALAFETDADGRIVRLSASGGRAISLEHTGGLLVRASDSAGRALAYAYTDGRLSAVTDAAGGVTRYAYDPSGRLATVIDPRGVIVLTTTYDPDGRVLEQRDGLGASTTFAYLADRVTTSTSPRGAVTRIVHDLLGRTTLLTDPNGKAVAYVFDDRGDLTLFTDRNLSAWRFAYDGRGNRTDVVDPAGARATFTYDARNDLLTRTDPLGNTFTYAYDARGNLVRVTDPEGGVTTIVVDASGQPTRVTDADGVAVTYAYDAPGNVTTVTTAAGTSTTAYDAAGRPTKRTDANGHTTSFSYDALGRLTGVTDPRGAASALAYDAAGDLVQTTDRRGAHTSMAYDAAGRLGSVTDALGGITTFAYDATGNRTRITDPAGKTTQFTYDLLDRLESVADPEGGTSRFGYDANGNLVRTTDPRGAVASNTFNFRNQRVRAVDRTSAPTTFTYDAAGRLVRTTDPAGAPTRFAYDRAGRYVSTTDALGGVTALGYTGAGRLASRTDPRGGRTAFAYDAAGRLVTLTDALGGITRYAYDAVGNRTSRTDALGRVTRSEYDAADRLTALTDAAGAVTRFAYDAEGALTILTDALGAPTRFAYDPPGRLVGVTDALGGATRYELDPRGLLTRMVDAKGNGRTYAYDDARRLVREVDPLGRARTYAYDASGNLVGATDPKAQATRYAYDAEDRLVEIGRADGELVRYTRDGRGLRTAMAHGGGTTAYAYDALRRLTSVTDPSARRVGYGYDASGNRTRLEYPDGRAALSAYDALDRLASVAFAGGAAQYTYDAVGNAVGASFANGTRLAATYDALDRPTALAYTDARGRPAASFTYGYDAAGNVVRETADGARDLKDDRLYGYDALRRLTSVTDRDKKATEFRYDPVGNRTATLREGRLLESASYDAADQLTALLRADGRVETAVTYDANGNLVARTRGDDVTTFGYDAADRLRDRTDKHASLLFAYDGDGNLVREQRVRLEDLSTRTLDHTLDVGGPLTQVLATSDGRDAATYLYGLSRLAAFGTTENRFFATDVRGSPRLLTDERGAVAGVRGFDTWGVLDPNRSVANEQGPAALSELFGFTGERQDAASGLLYLRARWYDPSIGRFLTRDPVSGGRSDPRTQHPYMYGLNDPVGHVDRSGRSASGLFDGTSGYAYDATVLYTNPRAAPAVGSQRPPTAGQRLFYFLADASRATGDFLAETAGPVLRQGAYDFASAWATTEENLNSNDPGRQANALGSIFINTAGVVAGAIVIRAAAVVGLGAIASRFQAGRAPPAAAPVPVIRNAVPPSQDFARVMTPDQARRLVAGEPVFLSPRAGAGEAFITSAQSLPRGSSVAEIARLSGLPEDRVGAIVRFHLEDLTGLATPIESSATGFIGRGLTSGGIPEYVLPNRLISELAYEIEYVRAAVGVAR